MKCASCNKELPFDEKTLSQVSFCPFCGKFINKNAEASGETFTDPRDGHVYKTVIIGNQVWLAENLHFRPANGEGVFAFGNDESIASAKGYLYTFEAAQDAAPAGWHLPTKADFEKLLANIGDNPFAKLASKALGGEDSIGFNADASGLREGVSGQFYHLSNHVYFWTATEGIGDSAYYVIIGDGELKITSNMQDFAYSVRLIKNA